MNKVPSSETKIGDRVRECYDAPYLPCQAMRDIYWSYVMAFDSDTGECYVGLTPSASSNLWRRIRSWVRVR